MSGAIHVCMRCKTMLFCRITPNNTENLERRGDAYVIYTGYLCSECIKDGYRIGHFSKELLSPDSPCNCTGKKEYSCRLDECNNTFIADLNYICVQLTIVVDHTEMMLYVRVVGHCGTGNHFHVHSHMVQLRASM